MPIPSLLEEKTVSEWGNEEHRETCFAFPLRSSLYLPPPPLSLSHWAEERSFFIGAQLIQIDDLICRNKQVSSALPLSASSSTVAKTLRW